MKKRIVISLMTMGVLLGITTGCGSNSKPDATVAPGSKETGISIEYIGSQYNEGKGLINHYRVHVADQNGKPLAANVAISLINGVKKQSVNGVIHATQPITFDDPSIRFDGVSPGDKVIIFPSNGRIDPSYVGDWTVSNVGTSLTFREGAYSLAEADNLHYMIGNEKRYLGRRSGVAHIERNDQNTTSNEAGYAYFDVVSDVILAGHTITIAAHTSGNRLGAVLVDAVRGASYLGSKVTIPITGETYTVPMTLWIDPASSGVAQEWLIDVSIDPTSFKVTDGCAIDYASSNFHTDSYGRVLITVQTFVDANATGNDTCDLTWEGSMGNIYLEY